MAPLHREGTDGKKEPVLPESNSPAQNQQGTSNVPRPKSSGQTRQLPLPGKPKGQNASITKGGLPSKPSSQPSTPPASLTSIPGHPAKGGLPTRIPETPPTQKSADEQVGESFNRPPSGLTPHQPAPASMVTKPYTPTVPQVAVPPQSYRPTPATKPRATKKGNRSKVLVMRYTTLGLLTGLVLLGAKSAILPPSIPDTESIAQQVQQELGITAFPAEQGRGFVMSYVKEYLTVGDNNSTRNDDLARFGDVTVIGGGANYPGGFQQNITEGPYIYGIDYSSESTAVYTIGANTNNGWVYLAINIYYDIASRSLSVATAPVYTGPPSTATTPPEQTTQPVNDEETTAARNAVASFFQAWAESDEDALSVVLTPTADARAHNGLNNTANYDDITTFEVYGTTGDVNEDGSGLRSAAATVRWTRGEVTYTSQYQLLIYVDGGGKWYVHDILPSQYRPVPPSED